MPLGRQTQEAEAVAATNDYPGKWPLGSIVAATMVIPSIAAAQALGTPHQYSPIQPDLGPGTSIASPRNMPAFVSFGWLDYKDKQPDLDRIRVLTPSVAIGLPVEDRWYLRASALVDTVTGSTPRYHSAVSGASMMADKRRAVELRVDRSFDGFTVGVSANRSIENDFKSSSIALRSTWTSEDRNQSLSLSLASRQDRIGSVNDPSLAESRASNEFAISLTQLTSPRDAVQISLWHSEGQGFFSDPYKLPDIRPRSRYQSAFIARWNHYFLPLDMPLRFSGRYYKDSFGVKSVTLQFEPVFLQSSDLEIAPIFRLYHQDAAWFYYNPLFKYSGVPLPSDFFSNPPLALSADQRLSSFGAATVGARATVRLRANYTFNVSLQHYEQRAGWHWFSKGSRGLEPLQARFLQIGLTKSF